jgi:CRP-like cAMP-binding protein
MPEDARVKQAEHHARNRLLAALDPRHRRLIEPALETVTLPAGKVLFEPGADVTHIYFPCDSMIASLVLNLHDGASAESAIVGLEGAIGGIVSEGNKPAFTRGVVQMGGKAFRLKASALDKAKRQSAPLREHFARYADCLLAQVLQSVACNAVHGFDARLARWLLTIQDRTGQAELHVTQNFIAEMLGVQRPYASRIAGELAREGIIERKRGVVKVCSRKKLEARACECYGYLRRHFERLLPGVYPTRS